MKRPIVYLICGVPGSGKTWVAERLADQFTYVPRDNYMKANLVSALQRKAGKKPLVTECPFGERELKASLEKAGFEVRPYFIVEVVHVVKERYRRRSGKELSQAHETRASSIATRALEWGAPQGTATEILAMLKGIE